MTYSLFLYLCFFRSHLLIKSVNPQYDRAYIFNVLLLHGSCFKVVRGMIDSIVKFIGIDHTRFCYFDEPSNFSSYSAKPTVSSSQNFIYDGILWTVLNKCSDCMSISTLLESVVLDKLKYFSKILLVFVQRALRWCSTQRSEKLSSLFSEHQLFSHFRCRFCS